MSRGNSTAAVPYNYTTQMRLEDIIVLALEGYIVFSSVTSWSVAAMVATKFAADLIKPL